MIRLLPLGMEWRRYRTGQTVIWIRKGNFPLNRFCFTEVWELWLCAELVGDATGKQKYDKLAASLKAKLEPTFWNNQKQAFVHNCVNGQQSDAVTRYANMFSVFFQYLNTDK